VGEQRGRADRSPIQPHTSGGLAEPFDHGVSVCHPGPARAERPTRHWAVHKGSTWVRSRYLTFSRHLIAPKVLERRWCPRASQVAKMCAAG
jgi:hypothetical protein